MAEIPIEKLHAACDECRTRKLKCSGETPQCSRCEREGIRCIYSPQKQMGRPRKRRRDEIDQPTTQTSTAASDSSSSSFPRPTLTDFGLIPSPELAEFSGFSDFQAINGLVDSLGPIPHDDFALAHPYTRGHTPDLNFDIDPIIDPSLWDAQPIGSKPNNSIPLVPDQQPEGPCTCLSIMYLTLSDLQAMTSFSFPAVIPKLRHAMRAVSVIVHCEKCPKEPFSAIQNVLTISSLLSALAERFHKVLHEIDQECKRLEQSGEKKQFRVGDNNPAHQHLHTGTLDCPMGFDIELEAKEWKQLTKKALKTEVLGGGSNPIPLSSLIDQMEERQRGWHTNRPNHEERARIFGAQNMCSSKGDDATCLRMITQVRTMVNHMAWE
ncbi:uncharacterized protein BDR25DRAFT_284635 [Lindgomyces ingoldianus]|uniref:Uncharacterized protein n=1 Tax=Lindgomyces ingoldianus TaxID=673940 RepID=A0ACB6QZ71_9PLEO|nr:uncharacterized protein BDR25DRAFT_284635 [Lindgomyces ingoldianus]KAF2472140.1 hypothetical protein BDR25DRAFT_284635 [Lindgomyces ingoldianus]